MSVIGLRGSGLAVASADSDKTGRRAGRKLRALTHAPNLLQALRTNLKSDRTAAVFRPGSRAQHASVDVDACARRLTGWVRRDTCAVRDNRDTYSFASLTANIAALRFRLPLYFWIVYAREDPRV